MRVFQVAMLIGVMTVPVAFPASAQFTPGFHLNEEKQYTDEEKAKIKANEDAARAARSKIPDAKVSSDPWATVRSEPAAKTPKVKSGAKTATTTAK